MFFSLCPKPATLRSTVAVVVWTLRNPGIYNFAKKNYELIFFGLSFFCFQTEQILVHVHP